MGESRESQGPERGAEAAAAVAGVEEVGGRAHRARLLRSVLGYFAAVAGVGLFAWLIRSVGVAALAHELAVILPFLPVLLALEFGRAGCELWSTVLVLGEEDRRKTTKSRLLFAQCVAYVCHVVMPAGRTAGEGAKAALLARDISPQHAAGVGAASQTLSLFANAGWALCSVAFGFFVHAPRALLWAVSSYALTALLVGSALVLAARTQILSRVLARWPAVRASVEHFDAIARARGLQAWRALGALALGRACQLLQLAVVLHLLGGLTSVASTIYALGLHLTGAAAGDLIPAQLGATDGAFVLAAPGLGLDASSALALTLGMHAAQLTSALVVALVALPFLVAMRRARRAEKLLEDTAPAETVEETVC